MYILRPGNEHFPQLENFIFSPLENNLIHSFSRELGSIMGKVGKVQFAEEGSKKKLQISPLTNVDPV